MHTKKKYYDLTKSIHLTLVDCKWCGAVVHMCIFCKTQYGGGLLASL